MTARPFPDKSQLETLERIVDATSLENVTAALAGIADAKADHIRINWQDKLLAREWDKASAILLRAANRINSIGA